MPTLKAGRATCDTERHELLSMTEVRRSSGRFNWPFRSFDLLFRTARVSRTGWLRGAEKGNGAVGTIVEHDPIACSCFRDVTLTVQRRREIVVGLVVEATAFSGGAGEAHRRTLRITAKQMKESAIVGVGWKGLSSK